MIVTKADVIETKTEPAAAVAAKAAPLLPVSVIVPARNEAHNLGRCLESLRAVGEVFVVDSQSTDETVAIAESLGARVVQFRYAGGWPKKRQWAMENLPFEHDWILLVDADEALTPELAAEIRSAIANPAFFQAETPPSRYPSRASMPTRASLSRASSNCESDAAISTGCADNPRTVPAQEANWPDSAMFTEPGT